MHIALPARRTYGLWKNSLTTSVRRSIHLEVVGIDSPDEQFHVKLIGAGSLFGIGDSCDSDEIAVLTQSQPIFFGMIEVPANTMLTLMRVDKGDYDVRLSFDVAV